MCDECPDRLASDLDGAFATFVGHHQDLVFGLALRLAGRPADAEDLAQECFVRAYRALSGYERSRIEALRPRGWLASIVLNLGRNRARALRRAPHHASLEAGAEGRAGHGLADPADGPEDLVARRESAHEWRARLEALPARYRRAVELRHAEGLSYLEMAEALDRPVGTVKSDVHRGVALLREALRDEADTMQGGSR